MDFRYELTVIPVSDVDRAKEFYAEKAGFGVEVSEPFHLSANGQAEGMHAERASYGSFATFSDPDGNAWLLQEVTERSPGR